MNEAYAYEPNAGGLEIWPDNLRYLLTTWGEERIRPSLYAYYPRYPFDGNSLQEQAFEKPLSRGFPRIGTPLKNGANSMGVEWDARGHQILRFNQGTSNGVDTASGLKLRPQRTPARYSLQNNDESENYLFHIRFKPDIWDSRERTLFGMMNPGAVSLPNCVFELNLKASTVGTLRIRSMNAITGAVTNYDFGGFTTDGEGYYDVMLSRWKLDANNDFWLIYSHGAVRAFVFRPKAARLQWSDFLNLGLNYQGKDLKGFDGRIAAFSFWRVHSRTFGGTYPIAQQFTEDPWWFLRGPEYPWQEPEAVISALIGSVDSYPAFTADAASLPALTGSVEAAPALDGDVESSPALEASVDSDPALEADVTTFRGN